MSRGQAAVGAIFLACLCICALGAASASALTAEECLRFEGVEGTGKRCGPGPETEWMPIVGKHKLIDTTEKPSSFETTIGGVQFEVQCATLGGTNEVENTSVGEDMIIKGTNVKVNYESCAVVAPAGKGCTVPKTLATTELSGATTATAMKFVLGPPEGKVFMTITVSGCTGGAAVFNGKKEITGQVTAEVKEATPELLEFTETSGSELKIGAMPVRFISTTRFCTEDGHNIAIDTP